MSSRGIANGLPHCYQKIEAEMQLYEGRDIDLRPYVISAH